MKFTITNEFRDFIRELRNARNVSTFDITNALGKKSTATYNNIETSGLKNSLKNIELETIYKIFSSIELGTGTKSYNELSYKEKEDFSIFANDIIYKFQNKGLDNRLQAQNWLVAFQLEYVLYEFPEDIQSIFDEYKKETNITDKDFILELNKNNHLLSVRGFKELNTVEVKVDIEDNYLDWGIKYNISEEQAEEYSQYKALPFHMLYSLLFNVFYSKSKNKSEVSKVVSDILKRNGLYILPDYFKSKDTSIITEPKQHSKEIRMLICQLERFANDNEVSGQILEKIAKNMESDNYFDFMSMPILATLVHFTPDKMSELKERITKVITELL